VFQLADLGPDFASAGNVELVDGVPGLLDQLLHLSGSIIRFLI
jgi:hypothetical protein